MTLSVRLPASTTYCVEVSGWDAQDNFFVAKADLAWGDDNGKQVTLAHAVADRAILFIRLVHATDSLRALPVPYEAEEIEPATPGSYLFKLHALQPRSGDEPAYPR